MRKPRKATRRHRSAVCRLCKPWRIKGNEMSLASGRYPAKDVVRRQAMQRDIRDA